MFKFQKVESLSTAHDKYQKSEQIPFVLWQSALKDFQKLKKKETNITRDSKTEEYLRCEDKLSRFSTLCLQTETDFVLSCTCILF